MGWASFLFAGLALAEENLDFYPYLMPGGAPVAEVNGIAEDSDGAIWVVTWGEGVHRIHGADWTTFTEADGLPDDWVRSVCAASGGGVWIGTGEGIAHIKGNRVEALTPQNLPVLREPDVFFIHELSDGQVWASTRGGWVLARAPDTSDPSDIAAGWRIIAGPDETGGQAVYQLAETGPGEVLVSKAGKGLSWVRGGQWSRGDLEGVGQWYTLFSGAIGGETALWAAALNGEGLYHRTGQTWSAREPAPANIEALASDATGNVFAATAAGLFVNTAGEWSRYRLPVALGVPALHRILISGDGAIWLGGKEGLFRGTSRSWIPESRSGGATALLARADVGEPVLAANATGEVFEYEGGAWKRKFTLAPWSEDRWRPDPATWLGDGQVWESAESGSQWLMVVRGQLWRVFGQDLRVYALDDGRLIHQETLPQVAGYGARYFVTSDERLLTLTDGPVFQREGDAWRPYPEYPGYAHRRAYVVRETEPGVFWAGVQGGLERWTADGVTYFGAAEGIREQDSIYTICPTRQGDIWFGSMGSGVYRYDGTAFHQSAKKDGLYSNSIRNIFEARDGSIWLAYRGTGISSYRNGRWVHFTFEHGVPNTEVLGFAETRPGEFWAFNSDQRLFRYGPDTLDPDTAIAVGPRTIDFHGVGVFSFTGRDAWNQTQPRDLHYSWRIVPLRAGQAPEGVWSRYSTTTTVASDALPRGNYRFEVRSSDENGNVDPSPAVVLFTVEPPLWMKPVFSIPVLLSLVLAAIAMAFRHRSHVALQRSEAALRSEVGVRKETEALLAQHRDNLESQVAERTRDLEHAHETLIRKERLATLGQLTATVSHELRNPLGTIHSSLFLIERRVRDQGLNLEGAFERMNRSVRRCDQIVDEMLDFTRSHEIEPRAVQLDDWLRNTVLEIGVPKDVSLEFSLNCQAVVQLDVELMRRVVINVLDNAIQAMSVESVREKTIAIASERVDGRAVIQLEDTGSGIPDEVLAHIFEPLYSTKNFGVGLGTNIVRNIMERHGGGVEYCNAPGGGARAVLWLPVCAAENLPGPQP